ncbi:trypsin/subtilisin inhibitor [Spinacia oleracea]|uniref:Trypsin/subtilisin inhibitor n=1 Tax=Spinacia oleracea TaxID=3562 RepID=A0A9R0JZQ6_SPIOL|nr:trypsin/subtilisin inhibitor-like [Spinacia oleracea]
MGFPPCTNPRKCQDSACCTQGKKCEWPELLGKHADVAKRIIERDDPQVTVLIQSKDSMNNFNYEFCCNRVIIFAYHGVVDIPYPQVG